MSTIEPIYYDAFKAVLHRDKIGRLKCPKNSATGFCDKHCALFNVSFIENGKAHIFLCERDGYYPLKSLTC